jgi:hypothetical protein
MPAITKSEDKMKAKPKTRTEKKREQEIATRAFEYGKKKGREDAVNAIIEALGLDDRYEFRKEDE